MDEEYITLKQNITSYKIMEIKIEQRPINTEKRFRLKKITYNYGERSYYYIEHRKQFLFISWWVHEESSCCNNEKDALFELERRKAMPTKIKTEIIA